MEEKLLSLVIKMICYVMKGLLEIREMKTWIFYEEMVEKDFLACCWKRSHRFVVGNENVRKVKDQRILMPLTSEFKNTLFWPFYINLPTKRSNLAKREIWIILDLKFDKLFHLIKCNVCHILCKTKKIL